MKPGYLPWFVGLCLALPRLASAQTSLLPDSLTHAPDSIQIRALRRVAEDLLYKGQVSKAKQACQEALTKAIAYGDVNSIGLSYRQLGNWYKEVSDYSQAIVHYQQALTALSRNGNPAHLANTYLRLGQVYDRLKNFSLARRYNDRAIAIATRHHLLKPLAYFNDERGTLESESGRYGQAVLYYTKAADYHRSQKDWPSYYGVMLNSAINYKNLKQYAQAERLFREVLAFADRTHDDYYRGFVNTNLPNALIPQNKLKEAEEACQQALAWSEQIGLEKFSVQQDVFDALSRINEKRGNYAQALAYYKRRTAAHDSVFNETKNHQITELETRYQTHEKEAEIRRLDEVNAQKSRQVWASLGGLAGLTILLGTLFALYQKVRRNRAKIQQQSDQLALMMKELHHRVKNNLAIVSSLLRLQSNRLDDEKAVAAVRAGQQRVEAMSLIHQRLYQTDRVSTVNMRDYLTDLAESLMQAYGYSATEFDLQLDIRPEQLDVDIAMPIGLIANELMTNAFKYAYADVPRPLLRVTLTNGQSPSGVTLEVEDNGPGIEPADWSQTGQRANPDYTSFGRRLIASLSEQLDGTFELVKQNGTLFRLHIPQARLS